MKTITFLGRSLRNLRDFPVSARREAGYQLDRLQHGLEPVDWRPMSSIGSGVREIRIKDEGDIYRVIYVTNIGKTLYVLHSFQKKTKKTSQKDIEIARDVFKSIKQI